MQRGNDRQKIYGARYLDPKYSRWISTDPALGEYIPGAPVDEEAKRHNQDLPGMGGVFNTVNSSLYHYAGNNPVKYTDPDGNNISAVVQNPSFLTGIGIILGTIAEDIVTFGAGIADDPATLAIGFTLIAGAYGYTSYSKSKTEVKTETKGNKGPYSVKVQFQGPSIKGKSRTVGEGCVEVNLRSDKPIKADIVSLAVTEKYAGLSRKEQKALHGAYEKVMNIINTAKNNGGASPFYKSIDSNTGTQGDRCDFLTTGEINLIP